MPVLLPTASDLAIEKIVTGPLVNCELKSGPNLLCLAGIEHGRRMDIAIATLQMNCGRLGLQIHRIEEPEGSFEFEGNTVVNYRGDKLIVHLEPRTT